MLWYVISSRFIDTYVMGTTHTISIRISSGQAHIGIATPVVAAAASADRTIYIHTLRSISKDR